MKSIIFAGFAATVLATSVQAEDKVSVQLDWIVRGDHAMFFVAKEKGYFAEQGIDVTAIRRGTGTPNALRLVGGGEADFGFGDLPTLAVARSQDVPVVALVAVNQHSPLGMITLANKFKLQKPQDLKGLNVGVQPAGSTYVFLKTFLNANGMTLDDIKQSTVNPPYENYLLLGRVDAVPGYLDAEVPELEANPAGLGFRLHRLWFGAVYIGEDDRRTQRPRATLRQRVRSRLRRCRQESRRSGRPYYQGQSGIRAEERSAQRAAQSRP
jgi:NitT/TauT family transport system substrate-binding protein